MARYEQPKYYIIKKDGPFEIRDYEGYTTSSVQSEQLQDRSGFSVLFRYINGRNESNEKMKMTVPVIKDFQDTCTSMEFVVPEQNRKDIPKPQDPIIFFKHYQDHKAAVFKFKGSARHKTVSNNTAKLRAWIEKNGLKPEQTFRLAQYHPPFFPGFLRKNEIIIDLIDQE
jgi:effector-binding domain-containing protein